MDKAKLKIMFCTYNKSPYFTNFMIVNKNFSISQGEIEIDIPFDNYEQDLGKKVCEYKLLTEKNEFEFGGSFEIFLGYNIGFCFIDNVGTTYQIMFLQKIEKMEYFKKGEFTSSVLDARNSNVEIKLSLNHNNTKDRANLLLINCLPNTTIKKDKKSFIDLEKVRNNIDSFSTYDSYQICFHHDNFEEFAFKKIKQIERLNMDSSYQNYQKIVDDIYIKLQEGIQKKDKIIIKDMLKQYKNHDNEFEKLIKRKFLFGKKILKKELNEEKYIDFIYKIIFLILIDENIIFNNRINTNSLIDICSKYEENKNKIISDNLLENYEKILLLIDIYYTELLYNPDYILHYYHINNFEKDSPIFNAYQFLNNFIDKLDYDSRFYYPLLLIDADIYNYKYVRNNNIKYITTYGFNMLSLEEIKTHLKDMIPNIILFSDNLNKDESAITNPLTGNIFLNTYHFQINNTLKSTSDLNNSNFSFIISKVLLHELFGHKKSSYSKNEVNYKSIISFKNEIGELKLISNNNEEIFKDTSEIVTSESIDTFMGDSGYFLEYFLGKIGKEYILSIIDIIERKEDLSKLLIPELWHKDNQTFEEYIKLMFIKFQLLPETDIDDIDNKEDIKSQIKKIKKKIFEEQLKKQGKQNDLINDDDIAINGAINNIFNEAVENYNKKKIVKPGKKRNYLGKNGINSGSHLKKSMLEGFTNGFFRK